MREWFVEKPDAGMRLDKWLASRADAGSRSRAAEWLARGKVFLDGEPVDASAGSTKMTAGQRVGVWMDRPGSSKPAARSVRELRHLLHVVYDDTAIVVVDKPAGLLVEPLPGREGEEPTLVDLLADRDRHRPRARTYVVHRIDRDTSGLVLFARTLAAREALAAQFARHTPARVYQAVVLGHPSPASGIWRDVLAWDRSSLRQRKAHGRDARGKAAEARYRLTEAFNGAALVEVSLVTGKRNQIRVQAAMRGHPLLGEKQYRSNARRDDQKSPGADLPHIDRQALHAHRLSFVHPATREPVEFTSPMPQDMVELLKKLGKGVSRPSTSGVSGERPRRSRAT
jgi:23S rRNA pseudouridine1911/1915/1917 synthase